MPPRHAKSRLSAGASGGLNWRQSFHDGSSVSVKLLKSAGCGLIAVLLSSTTPALACACGCGVFDIGNLFRTAPGGTLFAEYDFMDQNQNWSGTSRAPAANNPDKDIRTNFFTMGGQYLLESGLGVMAELPVWSRHFQTSDNGTLESIDHTSLGDIRLTAVYSGLSDDLGTGFTLGVKLPTGDTDVFDRDTDIGTGSTDLTIGAFRQGMFDPLGNWMYALQARYETTLATQGGYRPGDEFDTAAEITYHAGQTGDADWLPFLKLIGSVRHHDSGIAADPDNTGYSRLLLAPGIEVALHAFVVHAEVQLPIYQNVTGNQLVAPVLLKTSVAYNL